MTQVGTALPRKLWNLKLGEVLGSMCHMRKLCSPSQLYLWIVKSHFDLHLCNCVSTSWFQIWKRKEGGIKSCLKSTFNQLNQLQCMNLIWILIQTNCKKKSYEICNTIWNLIFRCLKLRIVSILNRYNNSNMNFKITFYLVGNCLGVCIGQN